jgi:hypothetical protein
MFLFLTGNIHPRGTSGSSAGDSGGGCFCRFTGALMAINIGCDSILINNDTTLQEMASKTSPKAHLVPLNVLFALRKN